MTQYLALATDFDETIATSGKVANTTWNAILNLRQSGIKVILITGRELNILLDIVGEKINRFDLVVAENGALIYYPQSQEFKLLCLPVNSVLIETLKARGVNPLIVGKGMVSTYQPYEKIVREVILSLNLSYEITFNKKRIIMMLPKGVNKGKGLLAALKEFQISPENTIAVGDAENDLDLLKFCGFGVAVANALPELKQIADWVTTKERGEGVEELISFLFNSNRH